MVELNSDEDSDVIIVETEIKQENSSTENPHPSTSSHSRSLLKASTSKRCRNTANDDSTETVKSADKPEESPIDVPSAQTRRKRRQQMNDESNRGDGDGPSRIKMIIRSDPQSPYSSTITTGALLNNSANATTSQANVSFDGSGPSTSVIRQPYCTRNIPLKKKKYTIYDASSESSDSSDSSSSDSSHEDCKPLKPKRLTKKQSRKTLMMHNNHKIFTKKLQMKINMKQMMKRLKEPTEVGSNRGNISSSGTSTSSSSDDTSSMDEEEKESSSD